MSINIEVNGLIYDENDHRCVLLYRIVQGKEVAFLKVLDGNRPKYYWGFYDSNNIENSIEQIMRSGAKWGDLGDDLNVLIDHKQ